MEPIQRALPSFPINENANGVDEATQQQSTQGAAGAQRTETLEDFLAQDKITSEAPPVINKEESANADDPEKKDPATGKDKTGYEKDINWKKKAQKLLQLSDYAFAKLLQFISDTETHRGWKINQDDIDDIMEFLPDVAEKHKVSVEAPEIGLAIAIIFAFGPKLKKAFDVRGLKKELAAKEKRIEELERKLETQGNLTDTEQAELFRAARQRERSGEGQRTHTTVGYNEDNLTAAPRNDEPMGEVKRERTKNLFNVESMVNDAFHKNKGAKSTTQATKEPVSTADSVENSTDESEIIGSSTAKDGKVWVTIDNVEHEQPYQPLNIPDYAGPTKIIRCKMTRQLFEIRINDRKVFIDDRAKQRWHYLKRCEKAGDTPTGGFPPGWKYDSG